MEPWGNRRSVAFSLCAVFLYFTSFPSFFFFGILMGNFPFAEVRQLLFGFHLSFSLAIQPRLSWAQFSISLYLLMLVAVALCCCCSCCYCCEVRIYVLRALSDIISKYHVVRLISCLARFLTYPMARKLVLAAFLIKRRLMKALALVYLKDTSVKWLN